MAGRPTNYTKEIGDMVCYRVATHDCGIQKLCDKYDDMPCKTTIRQWKLNFPDFAIHYARAKCIQVENYAEDIIDICDDSSQDYKEDINGNLKFDSEHVQRTRLRVDTRKWLASKLAPKIYGERKQDDAPSNQDTLTKIQTLVADLNKTNVSEV